VREAIVAKDNFDWTLASIPQEGERSQPLEPRGPRRGWNWLLVVAVTLAAAWWAITTVGWWRLRAQLQHEINYEDAQSRGGQVELVLAVQSPGWGAWRQQRAAEVTAGLPAPLPAPNLAPLDAPGQALRLRPLTADTYEVLVRREYADAAGQTYTFDLWQRYRRLGPGLWERLPPDETALAETRHWSTQYLSVEAPAVDWAVLEQLLPAVDETLRQACVDWACPAGLVVPMVFAGRMDALPPITPTVRPAAHEGGFGPYPLALDVSLNSARADEALVLPSPRFTGLAHGQPALALYQRTLQVQALSFLATRLDGQSQRTIDLFRDALIAREEIRLGLAQPVSAPMAPDTYLSPSALWDMTRRIETTTPTAEVAYRLQALAFLNFVVNFTTIGEQASTDAALLHTLRDERHLTGWLGAAPGSSVLEAAQLEVAWAQQRRAGFERQWPADRGALDGLAFTCRNGLWLMRGSHLSQILMGGITATLAPHALSPDGRTLALADTINSSRADLLLIDLGNEKVTTAAVGRGLRVLGWSAAGEVLYLQQSPQSGDPFYTLELWRLAPGGMPQPILPDTRFSAPSNPHVWSLDHRQLALALERTSDDQLWTQSVGLLSVANGYFQTILAEGSQEAAYAPDGISLSFLQSHIEPDNGYTHTTLELYTWSSAARRTLLSTADRDRLPDPFTFLLNQAWSPDGAHLALVASESSTPGTTVYLLRLSDGRLTRLLSDAGGLWPLTFAADGRYLATTTFADHAYGARTTVHELDTHQPQQYQGRGAAWSPDGHRLALANEAGVYVADPATGALAWVKSGDCGQVAWYALEP
jgi:Tol biopolymer transport system component